MHHEGDSREGPEEALPFFSALNDLCQPRLAAQLETEGYKEKTGAPAVSCPNLFLSGLVGIAQNLWTAVLRKPFGESSYSLL